MLHRYLSRLYATIHSRSEIEIEYLNVKQPAALHGRIAGRLRLYDGSTLEFEEVLEVWKPRWISKTHYKYHYQQADGTLIFRYDNAPHHPELSTYPTTFTLRDGWRPPGLPI
ncbi:MAG: DUF6516 family protein [Chloroflexota bacterium]|nr:DUF6516 family protein [Chloroflexota bacterium]